ncbi:MAG: mechanosensitive ion channel [Flavobacteriaceae bacterium]|nr:mechanosensitive ion channel [Flavobacteriaceae bacterium]
MDKKIAQIYLDKFINWGIEFIPRILIALGILIIGFWLVKVISKLLKRLMSRLKVDETLTSFSLNLLKMVMKFAVILATIMKLGIVKESMLVATIGAMAFAIGMALQGSLGNFAGGAIIMIFKPFKVGDLIEAQGVFGEVQEIQIFNTVLLTPSNKTAFIPNGAMSNGNIINFSAKGKFRVDLIIGISYNADIKKAKKILLDVMKKNSNILKTPAPTVNVKELADSSINLAVRPWTTPVKYWDVYFDTLEECKIALDEAGIEIPFPQRDIHVYEHKS